MQKYFIYFPGKISCLRARAVDEESAVKGIMAYSSSAIFFIFGCRAGNIAVRFTAKAEQQYLSHNPNLTAMHKKLAAENKEKETTRLEAFSDGVFAIAITLLVLELINVLHIQSHEGLLKSWLNHWQSFLAFFIGFCTILVCWINHHHIFTYIHKVDTRLLWFNGFVLLVITFTPFPTAILAEYLKEEGNTALAIFGFNYFLISIASYCISSYAYKRSLIEPESREFFYCIKLTYGYSIVYTLLAFIVCFISIVAAIVLYLVLFVVFAFPKEFASRVLQFKNQRKAKLKRKALIEEA